MGDNEQVEVGTTFGRKIFEEKCRKNEHIAKKNSCLLKKKAFMFEPGRKVRK